VNALERRLFYIPSFKIYGSVAGFYDYGPPGCAIKGNFTQIWRQHFVLEEGMLEVSLLVDPALPHQGRAASYSIGLCPVQAGYQQTHADDTAARLQLGNSRAERCRWSAHP
jgi:hypothetical protein